MHSERYIYDALYGPVKFPSLVWEVSSAPELQRLREVRLCNINSLCLPGGANISRYEHALGTCYLAQLWLDTHGALLDSETCQTFQLAALLHDVTSAPFGHSMEYVESRYGFQPERGFCEAISPPPKPQGNQSYIYRQFQLEPIYFGIPRRLSELLGLSKLKAIGDLVAGRGLLGRLINGSISIDLDNIDNVYRLSYHLGIVRAGDAARDLVRALTVDESGLIVRHDSVHLVQDWYATRSKLYSLLLLNADEFSAKCMLSEAIELARERGEWQLRWNDVDYSLLEKLERVSDETAEIVSRLMVGNLYGCLGIFSSSNTDFCPRLLDRQTRIQLENALSTKLREYCGKRFRTAMLRLHGIEDVNKTQRQVRLRTDSREQVVVGEPSKRLLIGVFFK
ncbi:MAG: hypothetical protein DRP27_08305, partial [Thermotogae bacterium]